MGGAAGHLSHVHEDENLTFSDVKNILSGAAEGRLTKVSEKLDGINLMFTHSVRGLRVARTTTDIKTGGMDKPTLAAKFAGRGNIEDAFNTGFSVLTNAIDAIPEDVRQHVFNGGTRWFSIELIYSGLTNTINYDKDHIVFHEWPIYERIGNNIVTVEKDEHVDVLLKQINNMQNAVATRNWNVHGPALVRLKKLCDGSILGVAFQAIDSLLTEFGLDESNTINDYLYVKAYDVAKGTGANDWECELVADRITHKPGFYNLNVLKAKFTQKHCEGLCEIVRAEDSYKKAWLKPIEQIIHDFSVEVLRGLQSSLVSDTKGEVERLRQSLSTAIETIRSSGDEDALSKLTTQMEKLKSIQNVACPMEGIVFMYKGQAYKFTGAFAPAHQIVSLVKYGKVKPLPQHTGNAFEDVNQITLEQLRHTLPNIIEDLRDIGIDTVRPIGTTGKKQKMSDIDLTCEFAGDNNELYGLVCESFGKDNVKRIGRNVSVRFPIFDSEGPTRRNVQVDLMPGDVQFMEWARYGPSPEPTHREYSPVKGVLRNLLLNKTLSVLSDNEFINESDSLQRKRYALDFDRGLFLIEQTKQGKRGVLKEWKTTDRKLVSSDPDEIVHMIFCKGYTCSNVKSFEQTIAALMTSENTADVSGRVLSEFIEECEKFANTKTKFFDGDPWVTIDYIKSLFE